MPEQNSDSQKMILRRAILEGKDPIKEGLMPEPKPEDKPDADTTLD